MKDIFGKIKNIILVPLLVILLLVSLLMVNQRLPIFGLSTYVVLSGSMSPAFNAGDVVVVNKSATYGMNDIITFNDPNIPGKIITHRIIKSENKNNQQIFTTKGDANNTEDKLSIPSTSVLGKVLFAVPKLGYFVNFSKTIPGFLLFIILPGVIIIISELLSLVKYIKVLEAKVKDHENIQS